MKSKQEILDIIKDSIGGTDDYHQVFVNPDFPVLTDGVFGVVKAADAFWLVEKISQSQKNYPLDPNFQVWDLSVNLSDNSAVLRGYNDTELIVEHEIDYTTFPLEEFRVYVMHGVILLPNEY